MEVSEHPFFAWYIVVAVWGRLSYIWTVRYSRIIKLLAVLPAVVLFGAGCGGFQSAQGVSPLDFLLPGLTQARPASPPSASDKVSSPETTQTNSVVILAKVD
jgi:hypothetical protein